MSKGMSRTISNIAFASHKSPSVNPSTVSSDMCLEIPRSVQSKTITDDPSTEDNNSSYRMKKSGSGRRKEANDNDDELIAVVSNAMNNNMKQRKGQNSYF